MRFATITTVMALLASAHAFVLPEGTKDGVYMVTRNADGTDVHTKMASANTPRFLNEARDAGASLERRYPDQIWCGCTFTTNPGNTDAAVADIKQQLGSGPLNTVQPHQSFYSIRGDVVAFVCNRSDVPMQANAVTFEHAATAITRACGRYVAGANDQGYPSPLIVGYQRYKRGDDFCASSTTSPANHC